MALGTPVAGALAYSAANGTTVAPAYPAGILTTDVVLLVIGQKPDAVQSGLVTTPTGWTLRDGAFGATAGGGYGATLGVDTGNTNLRFFSWNSPVANQTGTLSVTLSANSVSWAYIVRIPTGGGAISYGSGVSERATAPTTNVSFSVNVSDSFSLATAFTTGDMAFWAASFAGNGASGYSAHSITATGATFGAATELNEASSSNGNDIAGFSAWATVSSGTSSDIEPLVSLTPAGTQTNVNNVRGPFVLLRIREASGGTTYNQSTTETGSAADSSTNVEVNNVALTETGSAADSSTNVEVNNVALTESGSTADSSSSTLVMNPLAADAQSAVDTALVSQSTVGTVAETSSATDSSARSSVQVSTAAETLSATDASNQIVSVPLISGLINSDVLNRLTLNGAGALEFVSEAVSAADAAVSLTGQTATVGEALVAADSSTRVGSQLLAVAEALVAVDGVLAQLPSAQVGGLINSDVLNLLPFSGSPPASYSAARAESASSTDASSTAAIRSGAVAETASPADSSTRTGVQVSAAAESLSATSAQGGTVPGSTAVFELAPAADGVTAALIPAIAVQPQWITAVESGVLSADAEPLTVIVANRYVGYLRAGVEVIYPETNVQPQYIIAA